MNYEDININCYYKINNEPIIVINKNNLKNNVDIIYLSHPSGGICLNVEPSSINKFFENIQHQYEIKGIQG